MNDLKYLRNKEIKRLVIISAVLTVVLSCASLLLSISAAAAVFCVSLIFSVFFLGYTVQRYRRIEEMSNKIDLVLHGDDSSLYNDFSEGELAVLQSEIAKLTVRLREQSDRLRKDKVYLADSIADISHQIRTPLTSLNIFVSMLSENDFSPEKRNEKLSEMQKLLHKIEWQINALLKISKLDAGTIRLEKGTVKVSELIKKSLSAIAVPMDIKNQTVKIICPDDVYFCGDIAWTSEAITNILKNCSEHTPEGGTLTVEATENSIFTQIIISDTGSGISEQDLPHIFERFYKGENSSEQSVGIGLALAQMIVVLQNGTIKAGNGRDAGAVFTVKFYKSAV